MREATGILLPAPALHCLIRCDQTFGCTQGIRPLSESGERLHLHTLPELEKSHDKHDYDPEEVDEDEREDGT